MQKFEHSATDYMTSSDVARELGIHVTTVARRVASGDLVPAMKLPGETGAYLFSRADIEALKQAS